ncbi:MAG: hypothetical protein JW929_16105 [Anaerolineales bacterium]|nr:hypothetical protein [Anaerolineales bacterium]
MTGPCRSTRRCSASQFEPQLRKAFQDHFASRAGGYPNSQNSTCVETRIDRSGLSRIAALLEGSPDTTEFLGIILTEDRLIWARVGDRSAPVVTGAKLKDLRVFEYGTRRPPEYGLELGGRVGDRGKWMTGKLLMEPGPAAKEFVAAVIAAVNRVNPPPPKRKFQFPWFSWLRRSKD